MSPLTTRIAVTLLAANIALVTIEADAQVAPAQQPAATYPQAAYPQGQPYPQSDMAQQVPAAPRPNPLRELFMGTILTLLQGASGGLVTTVAQGLTGSISSWFDRKQRKQTYGAQPAYPSQQGAGAGYPAAQPTYGAQPYPTTPSPADPYQTNPYQTSPYPTSPSTTDPYGATPAYGAQSYDWSTTQVYDPRTGQMTSAQAGGYAVAAPGADATQIVAGGAYDVSAIVIGGSETYVNAATHEFRTGDRFRVYFRPTLPGRLDVYNINPHGRETRIDSAEVAAGQLTTLGPYEFQATKGDESLRFVLSPCSSQQLLAATRDIVNVGAYGGTPAGHGAAGAATPAYGAAPMGTGLNLSSCGAPTTRSVEEVKTRDIVKVGYDGTTSFALDPVSQAELASGQFAPREFTVYFHHR